MTPSRADAKPAVIAGAGPSGLAAAIVLARKGFQVEVHEAADTVGARWKRGLQIIENFSEREDALETFRAAGIRTDFYARPVRRVRLLDAGGEGASFDSKTPLGYFVKRGAAPDRLDGALLAQAKAEGVTVRFNSRKSESDPVTIVSTGPCRMNGLGKEVTFETELEDRITVILDPALAPGGYAYLFVNEGRATLGMAIVDRYEGVDAFFDKTVERFAATDGVRVKDGEVSYSYANFFTNRTLERGGRLFAGEAAGFQDYLFGFGIRFAIESGILAARSVAEGVSYDRLWKERLGAKRAAGLFNRFFYEAGGPWLARVFVSMARRSPDMREYLRGWYRGNFLKSAGAGVIGSVWRRRKLRMEVASRERSPRDGD